MREADMDSFRDDLVTMLEVLSHGRFVPSDRQAAMWFKLLAPYPLEQVQAAMSAFMRVPGTGRTLPVPADVIAKIEGAFADDGRPGEEEAWAIALAAADEAGTTVWTPEIAEAFGVARAVLAVNDKIGARMVFKETYAKLVVEARAARRPVTWQASIGTDPSLARDALLAAAAKGRIATGDNAVTLLALPVPTAEPLLLAAPDTTKLADEQRVQRVAFLHRLKASITGKSCKPSACELQAQADRARTHALKVDAAEKVRVFEQSTTHDGGVHGMEG